jgi:hypothetical protein
MLVGLPPEDVTLFLADRAHKGFNVVQFVITNWLRGDYVGRQPFVGEGGRPYRDVILSEAYWSYVDWVVDRCALFGMHAALVTSWGRGWHSPDRRYFDDPERNNYEFGLQVGRRYADRDHVLWVASGEYSWRLREIRQGLNDPQITRERNALLRRVAQGLRAGCGDQQLITFHPHSGLSSSDDWHDDPLIDFNLVQSFGHAHGYTELISKDYALQPPKPTLNSEPAYEDRWRNMPSAGHVDDWWLRMEGYVSVFKGGCGYTYGHANIYHFGAKPNEPNSDSLAGDWLAWLDAPGSRQMQHLRKVMELVDHTQRVPDDSLIVALAPSDDLEQNYVVATRARDRSWALVYTSKGRGFDLDLSLLREGVSARWCDPRMGAWSQPLPLAGGVAHFDPPGAPARGNDWVLLLTSHSGNEAP